MDGTSHPEQATGEREADAGQARRPRGGLRDVGLGELAADEVGGQ
jgi:hypothetical protein